jgi:hypothetical protein
MTAMKPVTGYSQREPETFEKPNFRAAFIILKAAFLFSKQWMPVTKS